MINDDAVPASAADPRPTPPVEHVSAIPGDPGPLRDAVREVRIGLERVENTIDPSTDITTTVARLYDLAPKITDLARALGRWLDSTGL